MARGAPLGGGCCSRGHPAGTAAAAAGQLAILRGCPCTCVLNSVHFLQRVVRAYTDIVAQVRSAGMQLCSNA